MASKTQRFRELIEAEEILIQPGVYDGFSARLVQQMGFKSAAISGAGLSETNLGWADVGLMGYEENLHASRAIAACVDIPPTPTPATAMRSTSISPCEGSRRRASMASCWRISSGRNAAVTWQARR